MHIEANRQAYRYNLFVESADKYKFNYRRVSYGQNTLGNTTGRLFVHRRVVERLDHPNELYELYGC